MTKRISKNTTLAELLAIVSDHLTTNGISAILTGGAVVSIYTDNKHESKDLDFISPSEQQDLFRVMEKIGFSPLSPGSKDLGHKESEITIEFPGRTVILGDQPEKVTHVENVKLRSEIRNSGNFVESRHAQ